MWRWWRRDVEVVEAGCGGGGGGMILLLEYFSLSGPSPSYPTPPHSPHLIPTSTATAIPTPTLTHTRTSTATATPTCPSQETHSFQLGVDQIGEGVRTCLRAGKWSAALKLERKMPTRSPRKERALQVVSPLGSSWIPP